MLPRSIDSRTTTSWARLREMRQDRSREHLERGDVRLVEHLQERALEARPFPLAERGCNVVRGPGEKAGRAPGRFVIGESGEEHPRGVDSPGDLRAVAADGKRHH